MNAPTGITLTEPELVELTRYSRADRQLAVLHLRGFARAFIGRDGKVVLERAHFEAVCRGEVQPARPRVKPPQLKSLARA